MTQWLFLCLGAVFGATARWGLGLWVNAWLPHFSLGTLMVNLLGCFVIGVAFALSLSEHLKIIFITGFLGSFTTFSSFSLDVIEKILHEKYMMAITVFSLHTLGGILLALAGFVLVKTLQK